MLFQYKHVFYNFTSQRTNTVVGMQHSGLVQHYNYDIRQHNMLVTQADVFML
jgi:hypothetical protein